MLPQGLPHSLSRVSCCVVLQHFGILAEDGGPVEDLGRVGPRQSRIQASSSFCFCRTRSTPEAPAPLDLVV